jgi:glycosyltransferase involved in cell wall biosynthesis
VSSGPTILHLRSSAFLGGPEKQILGQARYLPECGLRAMIGSFLQGREGGQLLGEASRRGIGCIPLPCAGPLDLSPARQLAAEIVNKGVSVCCAHDPKAIVLGYLAARRTGVPFVAWSRGRTWEGLRARLYGRVEEVILRRADRLIAVSHAQADRCRRVGVHPGRIRVIPNAIEVGDAGAWHSPDLRRRLGLPSACRLVLSVGRLSPEKGYRHLVSAAQVVLRRCPGVFFVVLGEGAERSRLQADIARLGMDGHFLLPGFVPDAAQIMSQADLFVLSSLSEGMPNVVLEAFAAQVPVVATRAGGVAELVRDGETGWLVERPKQLGECVLQALRERSEARRRASVARDVAIREFSFAQQARRVAAEYRELLRGVA